MAHSDIRPLVGIPGASRAPLEPPDELMYQVNANYTHALSAAGAAPVVVPLDLAEEALRAIFERLDGLCLAGGVDVDPACFAEERHPGLGQVDAARDEAELRLTHWALAAGMPLIGICRGIQVLNVAAGGSLYQHLPAQRPASIQHSYTLRQSPRQRPVHGVRVAAGSRLAGVLGVLELRTNSYHHQAVKRTAPGFVEVAWSEDGLVEGIELPQHPFALGVQWHPEGMYDSDAAARRFFAGFVAACKEWAARCHAAQAR